MERYHVHVVSKAWPEPFDLLVPFNPTALVADLVQEVVQRVKRYGTRSISDDATFDVHLSSILGPMLDAGDMLSDTLLGEQVVIEVQEKLMVRFFINV